MRKVLTNLEKLSILNFLNSWKSMKTVWTWQFNIRTASESNSSEHWAVKAKRHKKQKHLVKKIMMVEKPNVKPPCKVTMTRIAPRMLDAHDNLGTAMKWLSDAIADYLVPNKVAGRADDCKEIEWRYNQKKGQIREYGVLVEIESI